MVKYAQTAAEKCIRAIPNDTNYGVAYLRLPKSAYGVKEFTEMAMAYDELFYTPGENEDCAAHEQCNLHKQVFWHEAHEMGCGRAICGNETVVVCAYSYKQEQFNPPYIQLPMGQCTQCSQYKPTCNSYNLCCNDDSGYERIPTPSGENVQCSQRPDKMNRLFRFWHQPTMKNMLVTDPTENAMLSGQPGMTEYGIIGKVAVMPTAKCPHLMPIHRYHNQDSNFNFYEIRPQRTQPLTGYKDVGIIGYAVKGENICEANVPVYVFNSPKGPIHLQRSEEAIKLLKSGGTYNYTWAGIAFWMWE
ncbi:CAP domain containing protein [Trichuris trichiura]|uniref:CAP domain containing protein n=1 Tax=Trichuris trichiura TaxID=36087 RepID=A0A077Z8D7_TRITR|nr:CAP domain containing protein [Trichuris trichiura]